MSKTNREIDYYATSCLWLSLEDYSNAGLTQDEMLAAIEGYGERYHMIGCVRRAFINSNLVVETRSNLPETHDLIVEEIREILEQLVRLKKP